MLYDDYSEIRIDVKFGNQLVMAILCVIVL